MRRFFGKAAAAALLAAGLALAGPRAAEASFTGLYAFGDSLTDRGNLFALSGGAVPVAPTYANGQFSNGPTWIADFAARAGLGPALPSLAGGNVFAYGLARSDAAPPSLGLPGFINLPGQVTGFLGSNPAADPGALYAVWAGANNMLQALAVAGSQTDPLGFLQAQAVGAAGAVVAELDRLRQAGARNFLVANLPNLGRTPRFNGSLATATAGLLATRAFNAALATGLDGFDSLPGVRVYDLDVFGLFERAATNPAAFGLTNVTTACVSGSSPGIYLNPAAAAINCTPAQALTTLFWDEVHPTARGHELIAAAALAEVPAPGAVGVLLVGLAGVAALRRRQPVAA